MKKEKIDTRWRETRNKEEKKWEKIKQKEEYEQS